MASRVDMSNGPGRKQDSEVQTIVRFLTDRSIDRSLPLISILGMNPLQSLLPARHTPFRVEAVDAVPFLGQMQGASFRYLPDPTASMCEPLRFRQVAFAPAQ